LKFDGTNHLVTPVVTVLLWYILIQSSTNSCCYIC